MCRRSAHGVCGLQCIAPHFVVLAPSPKQVLAVSQIGGSRILPDVPPQMIELFGGTNEMIEAIPLARIVRIGIARDLFAWPCISSTNSIVFRYRSH